MNEFFNKNKIYIIGVVLVVIIFLLFSKQGFQNEENEEPSCYSVVEDLPENVIPNENPKNKLLEQCCNITIKKNKLVADCLDKDGQISTKKLPLKKCPLVDDKYSISYNKKGHYKLTCK